MQYSDKNLLHLLTMLECMEKISIYTALYKTSAAFYEADSQLHFNAVCHLLIAIGEESNKIDPLLKEEIAFTDWNNVSGVRNRIAHDYRGINQEVVFQIVRYELNPLKQVCISMIQLMKIDSATLKELTQTNWYRHLSYLNDL